jgi:hypothetical protein
VHYQPRQRNISENIINEAIEVISLENFVAVFANVQQITPCWAEYVYRREKKLNFVSSEIKIITVS